MSKGGAGNVVVKILTFILVAVLILGIIGVAAYFFLREKGVTYYVEFDGQRYAAGSDGGNLHLSPSDTPLTFTVKSLVGEQINYDVRVVSNEANNFGFYVGEEFQRFYSNDDENDDYSDLFGLQKNADNFTMNISDGFSVERALTEKFGGDVMLRDSLSEEYSYFVIEVTSGDSSLDLWFTFSGQSVIYPDGVTIDPPQIIY